MDIQWEFHPKYGSKGPEREFADIIVKRDGVPYVGQVVSRVRVDEMLNSNGYFFDHDGLQVPDLTRPTITRALERLIEDDQFEAIFVQED